MCIQADKNHMGDMVVLQPVYSSVVEWKSSSIKSASSKHLLSTILPANTGRPTYVECVRRLLRQHVEDLLGIGGTVGAPQVLVAAAKFGPDVIQGDVFVSVTL